MTHTRVIRDAILERLPLIPFFHKFKFKRTAANQIMPEDLPCVVVHMLPETMTSDGDYNAAEPRFKHTAEIGISVVLKNIVAEELEDALDASFYVIANGLLTDATFIGFQTASKVSGVPKMTRSHSYGNVGSTNETPVGIANIMLQFEYRYDYPPVVRDDLKLIHLETIYPSLAKKDSVQQAIMPIDLTVVDSPEAE